MSLELNSLCPGGTGKKIRACCGDNLSDLQNIQKMIQGQQFAACLKVIDSLLEKNPERACLHANKCDALFAKYYKEAQDGKQPSYQLWNAAVEDFYKYHPDNSLALVWKSLKFAIADDMESSFDFLENSFACPSADMNPNAMLSTLTLLFHGELEQHNIPAAIFVLNLRLAFLDKLEITAEQEECHRVLIRMLSDPAIPLELRQSYTLRKTNSRGAVTAEFTAALELVSRMQWQKAAKAFEAIAAADEGDSNSAYNSGVLYMERGKLPAASKMFALYASREPDPIRQENALVLSRLLSGNPLGDTLPLYNIQFKINDQDKVRESLLSCPQILSQNVSSENFDGPPPIFIGMLLDVPKHVSWSDELTLDDIPLVVGSVAVWGKRTDREAMLELSNILESDRDDILKMLQETIGDCLVGQSESVAIDTPSVTLDSFSRQQAFPENTPKDKILQLQKEHYNELLINCWPDIPLGVLGMSLREAAAQDSKKMLACAVIDVVEEIIGSVNPLLDFNQLRKVLNLSQSTYLTVPFDQLGTLPASLYKYLDLANLPDNDIRAIYARYNVFGVDSFMYAVAKEVVRRDGMPDDVKRTAYIKLCLSSRSHFEENLKNAKDFCKQKNTSDSYFD